MIEPALREKKRYLVFEVLDEKMSYEQVKKSIISTALGFLGEKGTGELGLLFLKEHFKGCRGIIRVAYDKVNELKVVLGLVKDFNTKTLKTTGTIKKAKNLLKQ